MEFFVFAFIVFLVVVVILAILQSKRADQAWTTAARQLGLHYTPGGFFASRRMNGRHEGMGVNIYTYSRGSGKSRTTYTAFNVSFPRSLNLGLRLTREGFFTGLTKFFGAQDIDTGDESFDSTILVKGGDRRRVNAFLTPARRARIRRFLMSYSGATIGDGGIRWGRRGVVRNPGTIIATVTAFISLARSLSGEPKRDRAIGEAMRAQHAGRVEKALAAIGSARPSRPRKGRAKRKAQARRAVRKRRRARRQDPAPPPPPPPAPATPSPAAEPEPLEVEAVKGLKEAEAEAEVEENVLEGELLYLADRRPEAKAAFERALQEAPDDPEVRGWVDELGRQQSERAAETPPRLDVDSVCDVLFDPEGFSFDSVRIFEQRYEGRKVSWSGKVRSVESYPFDFVFGDEPGVKATIEIRETVRSVYSDKVILAVLQLPAGAEGQLKVGTQVAFEGTLKKVDGFMKNIYLSEGRLVSSRGE